MPASTSKDKELCTETDKVPAQAYLIFAALCAGFLASQFYRVSNAVIAPELMRTLDISAEEMGIVTGTFFLTFAAAQLPAGILLDRFGPRRTIPGFFIVAVVGSVVFAMAEDVTDLALGRGLIGVGCAAGLMGALVAIARWFPANRFAAMSSLLYTLGGVGFLLATTPLAWASATIGWRGAFWLMAAVTAVLSLLLYSVVRDAPTGHLTAARQRETAHEIWAGIKAVANRQILYICAIQFVNYGTVLAVVGLWAGPYLNDVHALDGVARGNVLLLFNIAMLVGVLSFSVIERWINSRKWTIGVGAFISAALLFALALTPQTSLQVAVVMLVLFALASSYIMLIHAHARALLPYHLVGRGLTLQNLAVFLGVFVIQSITGFIVGSFADTSHAAPEAAYRAVFGFLAVITLGAVLIYLRADDVRISPIKRTI